MLVLSLYCLFHLGVAAVRLFHCVACWSILFIAKSKPLYFFISFYKLHLASRCFAFYYLGKKWSYEQKSKLTIMCVNKSDRVYMYFETLLFSTGLTALSTLKLEHVAMETDALDSITNPRSARYEPIFYYYYIYNRDPLM